MTYCPLVLIYYTRSDFKNDRVAIAPDLQNLLNLLDNPLIGVVIIGAIAIEISQPSAARCYAASGLGTFKRIDNL